MFDPRSIVLVLASACSREVSIVPGSGGSAEPEVTSSSTSTPDLGGEVKTFGDSPGVDSSQPCDTSTPTGFDDDLAISWCQRVSPELDQVWPGDSVDARCGMFNLIGDFGFSGGIGPTVQYCDNDTKGGIRLARYDDGQSVLTSAMLGATDCSAWTGSGVLVELPADRTDTPGELLASWPELTMVGETGVYVLQTARVGESGYTGGPWAHPELPEVRSVELPVHADPLGEPLIAFLVDDDDHLSAVVVNGDGETLGPAVSLADRVEAISAAPGRSGESIVATCDDSVVLRAVDGSGALVWTQTVDASDCDSWRPPGLATLPDGAMAIGWGKESGNQFVAILGPDRQTRSRTDLGSGVNAGLVPQIATAGDGKFVVMAAAGLGLVLGDDGTELVRFHHPTLAAVSSDLTDLGLWSDGTTVQFAPIWHGLMTLGPHFFSYDVIELSAATLPL